MAIKALQKSVKTELVRTNDRKVEKFISKGGTLAHTIEHSSNNPEDHRLTLRLPKWLMDKVRYQTQRTGGENLTKFMDIRSDRKSIKINTNPSIYIIG